MKKYLKIIVLFLLLIISFFIGVLYAFPRDIVNRQFEEKYFVLKTYGGYENKEMRMVGYKLFGYKNYKEGSEEVFLTQETPLSPWLCANGSKPEWFLYRAFGNSIYATLPIFGIFYFGGSYDGYSYSVKIIDCGNNYFIKEKNGGEKFFGPFYK